MLSQARVARTGLLLLLFPFVLPSASAAAPEAAGEGASPKVRPFQALGRALFAKKRESVRSRSRRLATPKLEAVPAKEKASRPGLFRRAHVSEIRVNDVQKPARIYHQVLSKGRPSENALVVDLSAQRAFVKVGKRVGIDTPVSTARPGKETPIGRFEMTERILQGKISTIYHAHLPAWMRFDWLPVGAHAGRVPGYPASAGCVRLPHAVARLVFEHTGKGTKVIIQR